MKRLLTPNYRYTHSPAGYTRSMLVLGATSCCDVEVGFPDAPTPALLVLQYLSAYCMFSPLASTALYCIHLCCLYQRGNSPFDNRFE